MITRHANHESSCTQINEHDAAKWTAGVHHVANRCTIAVRVGAAEAAQGGAACDRATASGLSGEMPPLAVWGAHVVSESSELRCAHV